MINQEKLCVRGTSPAVTWWRKPYRVWGWYGWLKWPTTSDGLHQAGRRYPFRWMARLAAWGAGRRYDAIPASPGQIRAYEAGGLDPVGWL